MPISYCVLLDNPKTIERPDFCPSLTFLTAESFSICLNEPTSLLFKLFSASLKLFLIKKLFVNVLNTAPL